MCKRIHVIYAILRENWLRYGPLVSCEFTCIYKGCIMYMSHIVRSIYCTSFAIKVVP